MSSNLVCLVVVLAVEVVASPPIARAGDLVADVDAARIIAADSEPGSWLAHGRTYAEERFSPLARIREANVGRLGLAWIYETGTRRGLEATPLVEGGVLYATSTWSIVFALDATTGRELWRYDPKVQRAKARDACCDAVNRGVALWRSRVYFGALDGRLIALDAKTGRLVWEVQTTDISRPYTITGAPRIVKGKVVIGNGGGEFGVRGYVSAYDAESGALVWRFYTVPGGPDPPFEHPELEMAAATWSRNSLWEGGLGGTAWDSMAYDPELDLLYVGVGNSTPYNRAKRSPGGGDNLFLASILALRPDTGKLVWHYQTTPGENWDYTATQHMILADLELGARKRKVLMQAPKNGFFYLLDRETGELLSAEKFALVSWASHVDMATGRPAENPAADWNRDGAVVVPGPTGSHNWHPMAYSPLTGLVYIPTQDLPYPFVPDPEFSFKKGRFNTGEDFPQLARDVDGFERALNFCESTHLTAWDPVRARQAWRVQRDGDVNSGVLVTAGNLVFQGTGAGRLVAYQATSGRELWASDPGVGIMAPPISYEVEGVQYVAVMAGVGGSLGLNYIPAIGYQNDGRLLVFKLDGKLPMPPAVPIPDPVVDVPPMALPPETVALGQELYNHYCFRCHGLGTKSTGVLPDLRYSVRAVHEQWIPIVLGGTRAGRGMASFADVLSVPEAQAIHAYVVSQALRRPTLLETAADWLSQRLCIPPSWAVD